MSAGPAAIWARMSGGARLDGVRGGLAGAAEPEYGDNYGAGDADDDADEAAGAGDPDCLNEGTHGPQQ